MSNCEKTTRSAAPLERLTGIYTEGTNDSFTVRWDTWSDDEDHDVEMMFREFDNRFGFSLTVSAARSVGYIGSPYIYSGIHLIVWIRPVNTGYVGVWQAVDAKTESGYIGGMADVEHNAEKVEHLGEQVVHPRN